MAGVYDGAVQQLIDELGRLPGVGPKSAQRIAFYLLEVEATEVDALVAALQAVKTKVRFCSICGNVTENEICSICADPRRLDSVICVVEEAKDIVAIERAREYRGRYHVLGGAIDPIAGVGPDQLRIRELYARLGGGEVKEVILAMDPNVEGEATATYLSLNLAHMGVIVSRLASGLPVGGDLEYADEITISRALEGRTRISEPATGA
ncbi:recombination protein RecR [Arcanobacterium wilhelmae]|uniref:Recombination protein RecR n=1 Tax=Arcanobacterium wilhelmae TaxID=1803177 RepID=A0ABT9NBT0_9ACTO|nr:recombination mediator RecR [Arcanobacterium wilhelmae]MDP9801137.1 recombination protein RecR [Arcanobacterium wilhelmae]WFN90490.1 recombination mediator RecR [Arcanobacterium wilhelmae]